MANWYRAALRTPTNTSTITLLIGEWIAYFSSLAGDPDFPWEVASSSNTGSLNYLVFRPKGGGAGRGILFGGTVAPNSAAMASGVTASNTFMYFGWSPSSTVNTPNDYTTGTPFAYPDFSGGQVASSTGGNRFYLYAKDGQLVFHVVSLNASALFFSCGPLVTDRSNTSFYQAIHCSGALHSSLGGFVGFGVSPSTASSSSAGPSSDVRVFVVNQWVRIARVSSYQEWVLTSCNNVLLDASNNIAFYPFLSAAVHDISSPTLKVFLKAKNFAVTPSKIFGYEWIDNNNNRRGYYLGYHNTLGSDTYYISLTNDDM